MSRKSKVFTCVGAITVLMLLFKFQLVLSEEYYLVEAWIENIIIYAGLAVLFGGFVDFLCKKSCFKEFKTLIIELSTILIGTASYYLEAGWLYIVNLRWIDEEEMEMFIESIWSSELPWLFMLVTVAVFIITLLSIQRYPRYITRDIADDAVIRINVDSSKVQLKECDFNMQVVKNMTCLRNYDYNEQHTDLAFFDTTESNEIFNSATDKFYMAEYDGKPMGYFVVRENTGIYEIIEFYASHYIDASFQVLYIAMCKYFDSIKKASVCIKNVGLLDKHTSFIIELLVKSYTDANYQLIGTNEDSEKINYDICFEA